MYEMVEVKIGWKGLQVGWKGRPTHCVYVQVGWKRPLTPYETAAYSEWYVVKI
jgi:hypothetical protein